MGLASKSDASSSLRFQDHAIPLRPIGIVRSPFKERFGTPRQPTIAKTAYATIELDPSIPSESLDGLAGFSHIWVLFVFHKDDPLILKIENENRYQPVSGFLRRLKAKVHPPRLAGRSIGVFATRSPHRPNPIGLSCVELVSIEKRTLSLRSHDLVDGTIVVDIKPYLHEADAVPEARCGWVDQLSTEAKTPIRVEWSSEPSLQELKTEDRMAIESILAEDPRPVCYRGSEDQLDPYTDRYGFFYGDWNIVYSSKLIMGELVFRVEMIDRVR